MTPPSEHFGAAGPPTVLWWGRADHGYSRNRIMRQALAALGWQSTEFRPFLSPVGDLEALWRVRVRPDLVWLPCFRQRDIASASCWAQRHGVPLLFDPLISAYDKQVSERRKFAPDSGGARRLLENEREQFRRADAVLADTALHADFFHEVLGVERRRLFVVPVGAEESLFYPAQDVSPAGAPEVLFYGSFIQLQGPETIIEAARRYQGPAVRWTLLGDGPLLEKCRRLSDGLTSVQFEPRLDYALLPERIRRADILLGIFGATPKAARVIPNKVFQALACGKPVITLGSDAYPEVLRQDGDSGIRWVPPADPDALAAAVAALAAAPERLPMLGRQAFFSYKRHFAFETVVAALRRALLFLRNSS